MERNKTISSSGISKKKKKNKKNILKYFNLEFRL